MPYTAIAADSAVIKAPGNVEIAPSLPKVSEVPAPEITAPRMTNNEHMMAAVRQLSISRTHRRAKYVSCVVSA